MILLFDIGNTHTHLGMANGNRVVRQGNIPTPAWFSGEAAPLVKRFVGSDRPRSAALCSVVPYATPLAEQAAAQFCDSEPFVLTHRNVLGVGIDYPKPETIGPDRLANAVALLRRFGAPAVAVDFGTAVTFDVVDRRGNWVGGVIAPGIALMTDYLHEKTALLPKVHIRPVSNVIARSTEEAMLVGAVVGYRGLVREVLGELRRALEAPDLPVVATGGYAELIAAQLPEIAVVDQLLTLEGLRLAWAAQAGEVGQRRKDASGGPWVPQV